MSNATKTIGRFGVRPAVPQVVIVPDDEAIVPAEVTVPTATAITPLVVQPKAQPRTSDAHTIQHVFSVPSSLPSHDGSGGVSAFATLQVPGS